MSVSRPAISCHIQRSSHGAVLRRHGAWTGVARLTTIRMTAKAGVAELPFHSRTGKHILIKLVSRNIKEAESNVPSCNAFIGIALLRHKQEGVV